MFARTLKFCSKKNGNFLLSKMLSTSVGDVISPRHFGNNFRIPKIEGKLHLELTNPHPNDDSIVFEPEGHTCE